MKLFFTSLFLIVLSNSLCAQRIAKISLTGSGATEMITIGLDESIIINLSQTGEIISYGVEYFSERIQNYSRLENYNGRIDKFTN